MSKLSFATLCFRLLLFLRCKQFKIYYPDSFPLAMSSSTEIQIVKPEFIHEGDIDCCPIPGDAPNIKSSEISSITAIDATKEEDDEESYQSEEDDEEFDQSEEYETEEEDDGEFDQSVEAQDMMKGEFNVGFFTHISIPFSSCSPMKGAYICLNGYRNLPEYLIFTLTPSKGDKISKKYEFPEFDGKHWYLLPVDLPDVVLCEITGKGRWLESFGIKSLVFIREETPEEIKSREAREKLWSEAPVVKSEFVTEEDEESDGKASIPILRNDPKLLAPSFSMVKCKDDVYSKESKYYDKSSEAQRMLKGEDYVFLSHLSVPFLSPSPMKGAYICVEKDDCSPSLLFTFTDSDGKKTSKKYEFTKPKHKYEWHFLPIDLLNIVLCEIEGKGRWDKKNSRDFLINPLVFTMPEEIVVSELLSLLPWKHSKDDIMTKLEKTCYYFGILSLSHCISSRSDVSQNAELYEISTDRDKEVKVLVGHSKLISNDISHKTVLQIVCSCVDEFDCSIPATPFIIPLQASTSSVESRESAERSSSELVCSICLLPLTHTFSESSSSDKPQKSQQSKKVPKKLSIPRTNRKSSKFQSSRHVGKYIRFRLVIFASRYTGIAPLTNSEKLSLLEATKRRCNVRIYDSMIERGLETTIEMMIQASLANETIYLPDDEFTPSEVVIRLKSMLRALELLNPIHYDADQDLQYPIPESDIKVIAEAARASPSSRNYQNLNVFVLSGKEVVSSFNKAVSSMIDFFYGAPLVYIITANPIEGHSKQSLDFSSGIYSMSIQIAAKSLGYESVAIGGLNGEKMCKSVIDQLKLKFTSFPWSEYPDHIVELCVAVGKPNLDDVRSKPDRKHCIYMK
ncbi:hypothetical protein ADUPG1_011978 [Aduncisulcus paluster]|uniref:Nitroreductase domain-containing protein n=1 Tax=Aduncisulcus paluster TaxID=2918883 RepID=A0ABQ5JYL3_9EUKA|nr:hypothetical protein ADUPG1_011978 [Aduncisulcus paluster]